MGYLKREDRNSVFGIFNDQQSLDHSISILKSQKFRNCDISVLMQSIDGKNFAIKKLSKAPEGATTGAATGAVAGGILGWLAGAGALVIPGLRPFIAAGPIMAAIAGAGLGGTFGGITGGLIGLGILETEAQRYEVYIKEGGMLISIHVDDKVWETKACEILEKNGAINIATTSEKKPDDNIRYDQTPKKNEWSEKRNNSHGSE